MAEGLVYSDELLREGVTLAELNPLISTDLELVIQAYEEGNQPAEERTEESMLVLLRGMLEKQKSLLSIVNSILGEYEGVQASEANPKLSIKKELAASMGLDISLFKGCVECDGRITFSLQSLPLPNLSFLLDYLLSSIELTLDKIDKLMDPSTFYADICNLLAALRPICPQDILLLIAILTYLITYYTSLLIRLNVDWVTLLGALLFPLFMLAYVMLDISAAIGVGPLRCNINLIEASIAAGRNLSSATGKQLTLPNSQRWEDLKADFFELSALEKFDVLLTDARELFLRSRKKYETGLLTLAGLLGDSYKTKTDLVMLVISLIRFIAFLRALTNVLRDNELCADPSVALTEDELVNFLSRIPKPGSLNLTINGGKLIVEDVVLKTTKSVPVCFNKITGSESELLKQWAEDLDKLS